MSHHYLESDDEQDRLQWELTYCRHWKRRTEVTHLGCSPGCDETIARLRDAGILAEVRNRVLAEARRRGLGDEAGLGACIDGALGL